MASLQSLSHLARFYPVIFGKALSLEAITNKEVFNGRPDFIDNATQEIRSALYALQALQKLYDIDEKAAKVIYYIHVILGEDARKLKDNWVELGMALREHKPQKISATKRQRLYLEAVTEYDRARRIWGEC